MLVLAEVVRQYNPTVNSAVTQLDPPLTLATGIKWKLIHSFKTIEKDSYCATAQYTPQSDSKVGVKNVAMIGGPQGKEDVVAGFAYQSNPDVQGELKVKFNSDQGARVLPAPYWVIALGPIVNSQYAWSVVSDNLSSFLFVLKGCERLQQQIQR